MALTGMSIELENVVSNCNADGDHGNYTEQLRILAKPQFDETPVQCSAADTSASEGSSDTIFFGRYAVMTVLGKHACAHPRTHMLVKLHLFTCAF